MLKRRCSKRNLSIFAKQVFGLEVSCSQAWRIVSKPLSKFRVLWKPHQYPRDLELRLNFCVQILKEPSVIGRILYSDEKIFRIFSKLGVLCLSKEDPRRFKSHLGENAPGDGLGGISLGGCTEIVFLNDTLDGYGYGTILRNVVVPFMQKNPQLTFMQDGAPPHKETSNSLILRRVRHLRSWPPRSPEINAIEYTWSQMSTWVVKLNPTNLDQLKIAIRISWSKFTQQHYVLDNLTRVLKNTTKIVEFKGSNAFIEAPFRRYNS